MKDRINPKNCGFLFSQSHTLCIPKGSSAQGISFSPDVNFGRGASEGRDGKVNIVFLPKNHNLMELSAKNGGHEYMKLCIAEKPSVAKEIAQIIGAKNRRDGYYEGNGFQVSWTFGHLCTLKTPDDYTPDWKWWNLHKLPMIPQRFGIKLINNEGVKKQFGIIKELVEKCEEVINCGDAGIEGELIQRWVLHKALCKVPIKRLWISSLTEEAIKEGFESLKDGKDYEKLYAAGNARAIGDWLLGMNATRLYTLKYAQGKAVLSIGRVQTPTLALIVNRHKEIEKFVPQPYWELKTKYRDVVFSSTKGKFSKKEDASTVLEEIKKFDFEIKSFTKKKGKESPPKLFDLTALQVECNRKYDLSAEETLKHIQQLYEKKMVSYPRVDTTYLPTDMYPKIGKILKGLKPYEQYTSKLLSEKIKKSKKVFDDKKITDHHAIVPTGVSPTNLIPEQKKIYDAIARRFISVFYPDCIVSNTTVIGESAGYEFKATGKIILEPGWRDLYPQKKDNAQDSQVMPAFEEGEKGPHEPDLQEKETTPPKQYTEATLLRAMETAGKQVEDEELRDAMKENGIGRPSTRANIIETLFKRNYIKRVRKNLVPTSTGVELIETINNELLKSVELTGIWEKKLRQIEKGDYEAKLFMEEMKQMVSEIVSSVKSESGKNISIEAKEEEKPKEAKKQKKKTIAELKCPKCKRGNILKGKTAFGCSAYKEGCNFKVTFEYYGKKITENQIIRLIEKGSTTQLAGFVVVGKKEKAKLVLNDNAEVEIQLVEPITENKKSDELVCPKCGKGKMLKGKTAYGCSEYKNGCKFVIPFTEIEGKDKNGKLTAEVLSTFST